ncbi:MAG: class II aldolase/adducin family protein [Woeseiaceae bacterium]|nr:class II aldolase/adducin family protein [Woeseiaceae bacterium]
MNPGNAANTDEARARIRLTQAIGILQNLGIIDFNGHFSVRLSNGNILINTGSSVRSAITPEDFVVVSPEGAFDESQPKPPMELPLHVSVYRARPDVNAVVHCHPVWSTLLSSAGVDYCVTMAQGALLGNVPCFASPRSVNNEQIAKDVAALLGKGRAALLRAHGSVVAAADALEATVLAIYLELNAERQYRASLIGKPYVFSDEETHACQKGLMKRGLFEKCWNFYLEKFGLSPAT